MNEDLWVDDLITGGENSEQVVPLQDTAIEIFHKAGCKLCKWHSNVPVLEGKELVNETDQIFGKQQLRVKLNVNKNFCRTNNIRNQKAS